MNSIARLSTWMWLQYSATPTPCLGRELNEAANSRAVAGRAALGIPVRCSLFGGLVNDSYAVAKKRAIDKNIVVDC